MPLLNILGSAGAPKVDLRDSPNSPPWKQLSQPVYSLVTRQGSKVNANVVTYAIPCSVDPPMYAISIFKNTQTHTNLFTEDCHPAVLQILGQQHLGLIPILGKKSGRDTNKMLSIQEMGFSFRQDNLCELPILADAVGYIAVQMQSSIEAGDHDVAICSVLEHKKLSLTSDPLTSLDIRDSKILEGT